jgi:hypothetical protein
MAAASRIACFPSWRFMVLLVTPLTQDYMLST